MQTPVKIEPPDLHHFNAAQGWLGLGNVVEADHELQLIAPHFQQHPDVLELRWQVYAKARNWPACVEVAEHLVKNSPEIPQGWIHRSYALHEMRMTREALESLLPAVSKFPKEWLIHYNLACYCCRLRQFDRTMSHLKEACKLGDAQEVKKMAIADTDLTEIREQIAGM